MIKPSHIQAIRDEFKEIDKNKAWNQVYQKVRTEGAYDLSCSVALKPPNKCLNRYKDVLPYDHSRIVLEGSNMDYINASLVEVESIGRKYILSQGPLSQTTPHFWLLIWQQNTKGIVMLNKILEKNQIKCHQYWPIGEKRGGENETEYPSVNLKVELLKDVNHSHYIYRTFRLTNTNTNESREILHFHYTTWSDFGVPQSPDAFFKFLSVVRASQCLDPQYGPSVIHCSAGIGRSGTFCLVDSILLMLDRGLCSAQPGKVLEVLLDMRRYRMGLIQTPDQLRFSYQAIIYGAQRLDETNGKDPNEESSSEEVSIEEAPPLPPPRTDSLTRSMLEGELRDSKTPDGSDADTSDDDQGDTNHFDDDDEDEEEEEEEEEEDLSPKENNPTRRYEKTVNDSTDALGRPLPSEPSESPLSPEISLPTTPDDQNNSCASGAVAPSAHSAPSDATELRRRHRLERVAATSAKVAAIKERTRDAERWQERKRLLAMPLSVCAVVLVIGIGGGFLYYYRQLHSS